MIVVGAMVIGAALGDASFAIADERSKQEMEGKELYVQHCSLCHGADARGRTAYSELIRVETPDLTRIALRRQGWFPEVLVREIIDGRFKIHGDRMMPIWGNALSRKQLVAITEYLYGMQESIP
jgi:mono/diheme cytochrome c family protein